MNDSPQEALAHVASMSESERQDQRTVIKSQVEPQLKTTLQRHVLACLLGERCTSRVAIAWASALTAEAERQRIQSEHSHF